MKSSAYVCSLLGLLLSGQVFAATITGAGSTFIYPLISRWAVSYKDQTINEINYQPIGSGGGLRQLKKGTIQFAAVDMPQTAKTLNKYHWQQYPIAKGSIVIAINVPQLKTNQLKLTGKVLADIFLGKIKYWNDLAIQKLNPGLQLPNLAIVVVHRADGSGTTYNFTHYLTKVSPQWQRDIGFNTEVAWPSGIGGKGNSGVAMFTEHVPGAISYVEYSFAKITHLKTIQLNTVSGKFVSDNSNQWPIKATTYALIPQHEKQALKFLSWGYKNGASSAINLDYIPISKDKQHATSR